MSPKALVARIDENTSVPLKIVGPVFMALAGLMWWLSSQFAAIDSRIAHLEWKLDQNIQQRASAARPGDGEALTRGQP